MLKRCLVYLTVGVVLSVIIYAFFNARVSGWVSKWLFVQGFEKVFNVQLEVEEFRGGIFENPRLKRVHLSWPQGVMLRLLRARQVTFGGSIFDLLGKKKDRYYFADLESVLLKLRPLLKIKFQRPLFLMGREFVFEEPHALRMSVSREGLVLENLQEAFLYLQRIFLQTMREGEGSSYRLFAETPKKNHRNQLFVRGAGNDVRIKFCDYSLSEFSSFIPQAKILGGVLDGEISWTSQGLEKIALDIQNLRVVFNSGREILGSLKCLFDGNDLEIKHFYFETQELRGDIKGEIRNILSDSDVMLNSKLNFGTGSLVCDLTGPLQDLQATGVYRKLDEGSNQWTDLLHWDLKATSFYFVDAGLYLEGAQGRCVWTQNPRPLNIRGNFVIGRRGVIIRQALLEDAIHAEGQIRFFQTPSYDLEFLVRKRAFQVQGYPFLLKNFAASLKGSPEDPIFQGSGTVRGFDVESRMNIVFQKQALTVGITSVDKELEQGLPPFSMQVVVDPRKEKVMIEHFKWGSLLECEGYMNLEKMTSFLQWFYASDFKSTGLWNSQVLVRALKLGPFHLAATLDIKGRYEASNRKLSWKSDLAIQDLYLNGSPLPVGKSILWYDPKLKRMQLDGLPLGKEYLLKGSYDLKMKNVDFTLEFNNAELSNLDLKFKDGQSPFLGGRVKGKVHLVGDPDFPRWDGRLHVREGRLYDQKCEEAFFYLSGFGSQIDLKNSRLMTSSGRWIVSGSIDLTKVHPFKNLDFAMDPQHMGMEGLAIKKDDDFKELTLEKQINDKFALSLRARPVLEESWVAEGESETEVQLEYEVQPQQDVLFRMDENEQMFGVRRKFEF